MRGYVKWIQPLDRDLRAEREVKRERKKKGFSYNSYFHLAFYKIYSLIQM